MLAQLEPAEGLRVYGRNERLKNHQAAFLPIGNGAWRVFWSHNYGKIFHEGVCANGPQAFTGKGETVIFPTLHNATWAITADLTADTLPYGQGNGHMTLLHDVTSFDYVTLPPIVIGRWIGAIDETTIATYVAAFNAITGEWLLYKLSGDPRDSATGTQQTTDTALQYIDCGITTELNYKPLRIREPGAATPSVYGTNQLKDLTPERYRFMLDNGALTLAWIKA